MNGLTLVLALLYLLILVELAMKDFLKGLFYYLLYSIWDEIFISYIYSKLVVITQKKLMLSTFPGAPVKSHLTTKASSSLISLPKSLSTAEQTSAQWLTSIAVFPAQEQVQ